MVPVSPTTAQDAFHATDASTGRNDRERPRRRRPLPSQLRRRRVVALVMLATALVGALVALTMVIGSYRRVVHPATQTPTRQRDTSAGAVPAFVSINATRGLDNADLTALVARATAAGLPTTVVHQGTLDLTAVERAGTRIRAAPDGTGYPMSTLAVDPAQIAATTSNVTASVIDRGLVVVGAGASHTDDLRVGDRITLTGWTTTSATFVIGAIAPDTVVSGTELMMSIATARTIGLDRPFSIRVWGFTNRAAATTFAKSTSAAWTRQPIRVRTSWNDPFLDDTVPQARIKVLLGEFWVRRGINGSLQVDPGWKAANTTNAVLPIIGPVRCHNTVATAAAAALQELSDAGLALLIHTADTRRYGGCFSARVTRSLVGNSGHNLSRHTWGAAVDINPSQNPYGGPSRMDQRVIDAFGRHGFVWGGTFLVPDPMHFEYVGAAR